MCQTDPFGTSFTFFFFYLLILERERKEGREKHRFCCPTYLCLHWLLLLCALTGDKTRNTGASGRCSNQLSYPARASFTSFTSDFISSKFAWSLWVKNPGTHKYTLGWITLDNSDSCSSWISKKIQSCANRGFFTQSVRTESIPGLLMSHQNKKPWAVHHIHSSINHNSQKVDATDERINKMCTYQKWNIFSLKKEILTYATIRGKLEHVLSKPVTEGWVLYGSSRTKFAEQSNS